MIKYKIIWKCKGIHYSTESSWDTPIEALNAVKIMFDRSSFGLLYESVSNIELIRVLAEYSPPVPQPSPIGSWKYINEDNNFKKNLLTREQYSNNYKDIIETAGFVQHSGNLYSNYTELYQHISKPYIITIYFYKTEIGRGSWEFRTLNDYLLSTKELGTTSSWGDIENFKMNENSRNRFLYCVSKMKGWNE
jgi:hypothetical protein